MYLTVPGGFLLAVRVCASLLTKDTFWDSFENKDAFSIDTVICSRLTATEPPPPSSLLLLFVPLFSSSEACLTWNILIENRYPRISVRIVSLPLPFTHTHRHTLLYYLNRSLGLDHCNKTLSEWKTKNKLGVIQQIYLLKKKDGYFEATWVCRSFRHAAVSLSRAQEQATHVPATWESRRSGNWLSKWLPWGAMGIIKSSGYFIASLSFKMPSERANWCWINLAKYGSAKQRACPLFTTNDKWKQ